jgi:hypothetical protein
MKQNNFLDHLGTIRWPICLLVLLHSSISTAEQANRYRPMANSMMEMMDAFSSAFRERGRKHADQAGSNNAMPWSGNALSWGSSPWSMGSMPMTSNMSPWSMSGMPMGNPMSPWSMGGMPMTPSMSPWSMGNMPTPQSFNPWQWSENRPPENQPPGSSSPFPWWPSATANPLEGRWVDPQGHLLVITGERFAIARSAGESSTGRILINDERTLTLYPGDEAQGRPYEYAVKEGKLALRDEQGNLLLFRHTQQ